MKYIYGLCLAVGMLLMIGFAGGSDCGNLTFGQAVWYSLGSMLVALIGWAGLRAEEAKK